MADVRAEILAASRSRTGWLEGNVQNSENQPFVSKVKSTFEEKTVTEDKTVGTTKSEAVRKLGSKVSSIANLFQSFAPKDSNKSTNVQLSKGVARKKETEREKELPNEVFEPAKGRDSESHVKRFNTARAIFERLEEENKKSGLIKETSRHSLSSRSPSQSITSPGSLTPSEESNHLPFPGQQENKILDNCSDHGSELRLLDAEYPVSPGPVSPHVHKYMSDEGINLETEEEKPPIEPRTTSLGESRALLARNTNVNAHVVNSVKPQPDQDSNANKTSAQYEKYFQQNQDVPAKKQELDNAMPIYAQVVKKKNRVSVEQKSNSSTPTERTEMNHLYAVPKQKFGGQVRSDRRDDEKSDSGISSAVLDSEHESEELLRVTDGSIELLCRGRQDIYAAVKKDKLPKTHAYPNGTSEGSCFSSGQVSKSLLPPHGILHYSQDSESLDTSWENLGLTNSDTWSKKTDNFSDQEDSENGSFCGTSSSLRDSAGETLAEFECRENELFFVEAVLGSDGQVSVREPFPSMRHSTDSEASMEFMTREEAERLLSVSSREVLKAEEEARDVTLFLSRQSMSGSDQSESWSAAPSIADDIDEDDDDGYSSVDPNSIIPFPAGTKILYEDSNYHILSDGHFMTEVAGLDEESEDEDLFAEVVPHKRTKVRFNFEPIKVFSTFSVEDYDRRNDDVDPVAASAEYELEKRIEKMDVFPVELVKGPEGLGLSIIGMGVGADAGLEKLGIFVKSITGMGAAHKDGRIAVNDQIIEVDGKSLVGVTQAYAASVLRSTSGLVKFLIGRENDNENSEIAQLISQSLQADKEQKTFTQPPFGQKDFQLPLQGKDDEPRLDSNESSRVSQGSTPEEGEDAPTVEVFDLTSGSSGSLSPDTDMETLRNKLKEVQYRNAVAEADLRQAKEKLATIEKMEADRQKMLKRLDSLQHQMGEREIALQSAKQQLEDFKGKMAKAQQQLQDVERKYSKAKKIIKEFQKREKDFLQQEEFHIQQLQEKDQEYNALVKVLKDRVILLEHTLTEVQKSAGLPLQLPYDIHQLTPQLKKKNQNQSGSKLTLRHIEVDMSDCDVSDYELNKHDLSPDAASEDSDKRSTVERKIPKGEQFSQSQPLPDLLEPSSARQSIEGSIRICPSPKCGLEDAEGASDSEKTSSDKSCDGASKEPRGSLSDSDQSLARQNAHSKAMSFAEEIKVAVLEWHTKVGKPSDDAFMELEPEFSDQLFSQGMQIEKCDYPSHTVDEHHSVPPSYQHATEEGFDMISRQASPRPSLRESDSLPPTPDSPPVEIPPKKRNYMQGDPNRLSASIDGSTECLKKENRVTFPAAGSKIQRPSAVPPRVPERSSSRDRRPHHWQGRSIHMWTTSQVGQWLMALGLEQYIKTFQEQDITGQQLLNLDSAKLKMLGVQSSNDRSIIKKKVKEVKAQLEKERKAQEKEQKAREKQQKKAEKAKKK